METAKETVVKVERSNSNSRRRRRKSEGDEKQQHQQQVTKAPAKPPRLNTNITINTSTLRVNDTITQYYNNEEVIEGVKEEDSSKFHNAEKMEKKKKKLKFQSPLPDRYNTATTIITPAPSLTMQPIFYANTDSTEHDSKNVGRSSSATTATKTSTMNMITSELTATTTTATARTKRMATSAIAAYPVSSQQQKQQQKSSRTTTTTTILAEVAAKELATIKNRLAHGCTSLMYACQHGDIAEVLEQLRSKPERIRQRDSHNKNALHYCAAQNVQETRDLVAAASIAIAAPELLESADEDGFTPLHLAVIQGNLAMVNLLLANKADVNAVDNEGHSVVHWATVCGEVEALRTVLAAGGNVATPDINGGSPLHYAAQMCGASYEQSKLGQTNSSKLALEILDILLAHPQSSVDIQDKDGRQPLLWAASAGSAKAVIALVKAGSRIESADKDGLTALHCAASRGHTECIDTLISLCGAPTDLIDSNGCTALHYAVTLGHADATSRLLDLEADPNRQDRKGRTPAHCGCSKGQFETVKLLKERGANLWLRNAKGDLPVHEAASSGRRELVEWLLEQRAKQVNTTSNDGRSLLHIAAANDYTDMCKMLLDYGADINAIYRNSKGTVITPLDCALQKGHRSTAKFVQSNGGLPAGKLRLAARRANPFQDHSVDVVRPLKYAEKEEIHDLQNSKKYVVYLKRSDSDGGGGDGSCSCAEQTYRKEHRYAHTCRRHQRSSRKQQLRRRTSSCGEAKDGCRGKDCTGICRSKSNIEIRRRKSRERYASSSELDEKEDDEDSCENCCYHKRQKQRVVRRRSTSLRRSKDLNSSDAEDGGDGHAGEDSSPEKRGKRAAVEEAVASKEKIIEVAQEKSADAVSRPGSKSSTRSRPQSATKRHTTPPPASAGKEATFIKSPTQSAKSEKTAEETHAMELTDEDESASKAAEVVTTQVDVHRGADDTTSLKMAAEAAIENESKEDNKGTEIHRDSLSRQISKEIDQVLTIAATAIYSESKSLKDMQDTIVAATNEETNAAQESNTKEDQNVVEQSSKATETEVIRAQTNTASLQDKSIAPPSLTQTPATPVPTPAPSPTPKAANTPQGTSAAQLPQKDSEAEAKQGATSAASKAAAATPTTEEAQTKGAEDPKQQHQLREQESRRSFTLLPSDSADDDLHDDADEQISRKSSFQVLKSDESVGEAENAIAATLPHDDVEFSDSQVFKIVPELLDTKSHLKGELSSAEDEQVNAGGYEEDEEEEDGGVGAAGSSPVRTFKASGNRHGIGAGTTEVDPGSDPAVMGIYDYSNGAGGGRKRRLKKRVKSGTKTRSNWKSSFDGDGSGANITKDQDSGFEPSPRTLKSKIPTPRNIYTAHVPRRHIYAALDGRSCSSRLENRKPGDRGACDMSAVTRSIQRNIRRYYMERKIFQHLLELKSLQIRSNKLNEAVLVKRAVDDYHKSCAALGGETGTRLRRYSFSEYTFKNFELFLYETLKGLQKPGTYNFQNINEVYEEAERRLSPDYNAYEKALQCTTKTHRCLHAAHAYTGIPCAAYIPMINHHTMPKFGFGPYKKTGVGSFYLPKILSSSGGCAGSGKVALELSHGKSKQLISLPSDKLDSNKRYYVTFTVKESSGSGGGGGGGGGASGEAATGDTGAGNINMNATSTDKQQNGGSCGNNSEATGK